jgi:hypothetical protein
MLGYASRYVIHANRRLRYFPEPDAHGTTAKGRPAPPHSGSALPSGPRPTAARAWEAATSPAPPAPRRSPAPTRATNGSPAS